MYCRYGGKKKTRQILGDLNVANAIAAVVTVML